LGETDVRVRLQNCNLTVFLHEGYDWPSTRRIIEEETKVMRMKLMKIRQMLASGQAYDPNIDETSALLFNSVYVGLEENVEGMDSGALIAAIDQELEDEYEVASQSSWQTLVPVSSAKPSETAIAQSKRRSLKRSRNPSIEFRLAGLALSFDHYRPMEAFASRTLCTVRDLQIFDHIKTSTWKMFLTELRRDLRGIVRETGSNMVRLELRNVRPVPQNPAEETRLRVRITMLDCTAADLFLG
jgi:autophagy-related protein 2